MNPQTVLILGAGASLAYGFPLGSGLRRRILEIRDRQDASDFMGRGRMTVRDFVDAFNLSQMYSIDAFLGRRTELAEVGKEAIAYVLLQCEANADLFSEAKEDHWYQYLVNRLVVDEWEQFDPSWLSVITFNYDRSLEYYLTRTLMSIYDRSEADVAGRLALLRITHVYGSLGDAWKGGSSYVRFGSITSEAMHDAVATAASRLEVIAEGRDDSKHLVEARALLQEAERVCFLGFGFDAVNIRRLGTPQTMLMPTGLTKRTVATCLGMTGAEIQRAETSLFGGTNQKEVFHSLNCIGALRHSLLLD